MSNIPKMGQLPTPEFELPFHRVSHNTMWNMQLVVTFVATIGFFGSSIFLPTSPRWSCRQLRAEHRFPRLLTTSPSKPIRGAFSAAAGSCMEWKWHNSLPSMPSRSYPWWECHHRPKGSLPPAAGQIQWRRHGKTRIVVAITNSSIGVYFFPCLCHAPPCISAILRLIHDLIDWPSDLGL